MHSNCSVTEEPSATSQVADWLASLPVGTVIRARHARQELDHLDPRHVSAALSLLASDKYGYLMKLPREGRFRPYRVTALTRQGWAGHARPRRHGGEKRPRRRPPDAPPDARRAAADELLQAATMIEDGAGTEDVLATIRSAYYLMKTRR